MTVPKDTIHLIVNPVAGHGKASTFVEETIIPIFQHLQIPHKIYTTSSPGDAGTIGRSILSNIPNGILRAVIAILGGDGTLHDFIEGVSDTPNGEGEREGVKWEIILLPFGTANALYSSLFPPSSTPTTLESYKDIIDSIPLKVDEGDGYKLLSLFQYLSKPDQCVRLPITQTIIQSPNNTKESSNTNENNNKNGKIEKIISHVVLSTSLHASILHDSEALRSEHPGTERFKIAALQNASKVFGANVVLYPTSGSTSYPGGVVQWDPRKQGWVKPFTNNQSSSSETIKSDEEIQIADNNDNDDGQKKINGPFSYFLSTSTVDRLEPTFVISPLTSLRSSKAQDEDQDYIYITIIRPLRDPYIVHSKEGEKKERMSKRAFEVIGNAYSDGNHINLTYPPTSSHAGYSSEHGDGDAKGKYGLEVKGNGEPVVEVFRCSSFDWIPLSLNNNDEVDGKREYEGLDVGDESLVCADGAIHALPKGGIAKVKLLEETQDGDNGFYVFA